MAQERRVLLANGQYITIVQTTGNSTGDVMSQSAVTAALNAKANVSHTHAASDITSGTFSSARIADGAITTAKLKDKSVTLAKLADNVPISTTPYETITVSGKTDSGKIPLGARVTIGGLVYEFGSSGVVSAQIPYGQIYDVKASQSGLWNISTYDATFTANTPSRSITLTYDIMGVGIEATDGYIYAADNWPSNKTANSIIVVSDAAKFRIALIEAPSTMAMSSYYADPLENYMTAISDQTAAKADYNGSGNTANIMKLQSSTSYAAGYCNAFTFPDGKTKGFLPSLGQLNLAYQNKAAVDAALSACGGTLMNIYYHWSSTFWGVNGNYRYCWILGWSDGTVYYDSYVSSSRYVRPFAAY